MGKNCVQGMENSRIVLWIARSFQQPAKIIYTTMCTSSVKYTSYAHIVNIMYSVVAPLRQARLYTVSTEPTITTICLFKKTINQESGLKRSVL